MNKGQKHTKEAKKKLSDTQKENAKTNPNFGMIGKKHTKETKKLISMNRTGIKHTKEAKRKISMNNARGFLGKKHKKKTIRKFSKTKKGLYSSKKLTPYWLGKNRSKKDKEKMSIAKIGKYMGKDSSNWKGGLSFEPYSKEFNNKFKRAIRKRDNQVCMLCGIHREKLNEALSIHHINYCKKLTIPQNCMSLCRKCHILTSSNRKYWIKFFQDLLAKRYNYQYNENSEIILEVKQ